LDDEGDERERTDGDEHFVAFLVVRRLIGAVDLGADQRADLYDHVVGRSCDGTFLDVEGVLGDPG